MSMSERYSTRSFVAANTMVECSVGLPEPLFSLSRFRLFEPLASESPPPGLPSGILMTSCST